MTDSAKLETIALPGIERARESDSVVLTRTGKSLQRAYNEMLAEAAELPGLEALVLLHQDLELADDSLPRRIRSLLGDPSVGLICADGWASPQPDTAPDDDSAAFPGLGVLALWALTTLDTRYLFGRNGVFSAGPHEVELADGILLAIAPWVIRSLRFDERLADDFHGYDIDFSLRVRAAGGRVICDDIPVVHWMSRPWRDRDEAVRARRVVLSRWHPALRPTEWTPSFQR